MSGSARFSSQPSRTAAAKTPSARSRRDAIARARQRGDLVF
jgi:hypothetical protein